MTHIQPGAVEGAAKGNSHTLSIDRRRHASISGVTDVLSFHETEIELKIDSGMMFITGDSLHIAKLLLEDGRLDVDGHIDSVVYEAPQKASKRLFGWKWLHK